MLQFYMDLAGTLDGETECDHSQLPLTNLPPVLSVPAPLRYLIAYDNDALNEVMTIFMNSFIFHLSGSFKISTRLRLAASAFYLPNLRSYFPNNEKASYRSP